MITIACGPHWGKEWKWKLNRSATELHPHVYIQLSVWWRRQDSNPRPVTIRLRPHRGKSVEMICSTIELRPHIHLYHPYL